MTRGGEYEYNSEEDTRTLKVYAQWIRSLEDMKNALKPITEYSDEDDQDHDTVNVISSSRLSTETVSMKAPGLRQKSRYYGTLAALLHKSP